MKTALIFDLDGTLLDTLQDLADAVNHVLHARGLPLRSREEIRRFVGNGAGRLMSLSLPEDYADFEGAMEAFQAYYSTHCQDKTAPYAGVLEALDVLGQVYPLAIVSNKPHYGVQSLCSRYFPGIPAWGESAHCPRKPAPDMLQRAMKALGAENCIYIGDSEVDVLTAQNAAAVCLSVTWGFREEAQLMAAGAKAFCHSPEKLPETIEKLLGENHGQ